MSERLNYKVNNAEECITECPHKTGEFVGSGLCGMCMDNDYGEYDDERMIGYVECTYLETHNTNKT